MIKATKIYQTRMRADQHKSLRMHKPNPTFIFKKIVAFWKKDFKI